VYVFALSDRGPTTIVCEETPTTDPEHPTAKLIVMKLLAPPLFVALIRMLSEKAALI
jgi:hypothetical protein